MTKVLTKVATKIHTIFTRIPIGSPVVLECAVGVYPVGINTTRTVHLFTRSGTDNRRVQKVADRGHTQKCHTTPEGPRSLHAATP